MTKLNDYGLVSERPIKREKWFEFFEGTPPGRFIGNGTIPPGMLIVQNYLDPAWCDALVKECEAVAGHRHATGKLRADGTLDQVESSARISEAIGASQLTTDIIGMVRGVYKDVVQPHFQTKLEWFETPEVLRYRKGGEYIMHSDAYNWLRDEKKWKRAIDRDFSTLMYINEEFEGGEIYFPNCDFGMKPRRGMLVAFPSDWRYTHMAKPVTSGIRYAIVSWSAAVGSPRVDNKPPPLSIML
ncbi:MAG: 2OG-Fe(II) oxygenase [Marinicaulis sp.]|nr:2OG-Fe(II) oxygenase [Marinicaulis sp.]